MTDQKPTDQPAESTGFWSVFHSLPFDRKNRFFKPYGKLLRIGSNTGNVFAPCPGYVAVVKLTSYTPTTGHFFLKGGAFQSKLFNSIMHRNRWIEKMMQRGNEQNTVFVIEWDETTERGLIGALIYVFQIGRRN